MFLLKLGSELQNLVKKIQPLRRYKKIQIEFRQNGKFPQSGMHNMDSRLLGVERGIYLFLILTFVRSSHRRCSAREGVFRNFAKFTGKHLRQSLS